MHASRVPHCGCFLAPTAIIAVTILIDAKDTLAMLERILTNRTFLTAEGAMNGYAARHSAISQNIANVNTPGYKRKSVAFEDALGKAVDGTLSPCTDAPCSTLNFDPTTQTDSQTVGRADGNNVDIEREMVQLSENGLRFQTVASYMQSYFTTLKSVINGTP